VASGGVLHGLAKLRGVRPRTALLAARPWSFPASVAPVLLGASLAFKLDDVFSPLCLCLATGCAVAVHAAGNLVNTYADYARGVDGRVSSDKTLVQGALSPPQVRALITAAYATGALLGLPLIPLSRAPAGVLVGLLLAGAGSSYAYTAGPALKYRALGDALIMATFGPLLVSFSYVSQVGAASWTALRASIPLALQSGAILHANNARDMVEDAAAGVDTLALRLGRRRSVVLYELLLLAPYASVVWRAARTSTFAGLPLATLPAALRLAADFRAGLAAGDAPLSASLARMPMRTAKHAALFALLTTAGVLLPSPSLRELGGSLVRTALRSYYDRVFS